MQYLTKFGVSNFKIFGEMQRFDLRPITILTGPNSSGKSSLIKALLAIKYNFKKDLNFGLELNKLDLRLGNYLNCLNNEAKSEDMQFELPIKISNKNFNLLLVFNKSKKLLNHGLLWQIKILSESNELVYELYLISKSFSFSTNSSSAHSIK